MAVIREQDLDKGRLAWARWRDAAHEQLAQSVGDATGPSAGSPTDHAARRELDGSTNSADHATRSADETMLVIPIATRLEINPALPRPIWAMAVRYTLFLLERRAPGPGVEVRVAPWGAIKILDGPASDPHNLTPPDVIELDPDVWLRLAAGITTWDEERDAGHITAVGERDDLSDLLPL
ncbi:MULTISPECIES: sterol carrier family protein [Bifidobacterium]|uniref:sterol carrier family protein n=1 Tax=Bifidobacterium TaxID=1678 RepID=UPI001BDDAC01|nr:MULTISPECIES: sterol carrier family protein [Bifidobacterium]MBT1162689.1 serine-pyruvate aminotransferase [Bifidobacterium sp. SO1]MBW3079716.1 serine-pyruvate aminotransferase [Bifidobacterium simiiventris]